MEQEKSEPSASMPPPSLDRTEYLRERSMDIHRGRLGWNLLDPPPPTPEKPPRHPYLGALFHGFMIANLLIVVFGISGLVLVFYLNRRHYSVSSEIAYLEFIIGGCLGVGVILWSYFRKLKDGK